MSDLLQKIKLGGNNFKLIKWPGTDVDVALHVLSEHELQESLFETENIFKAAGILNPHMMNANGYTGEEHTQILFRALRDPSHREEPIAKNITEFRKALTASVKIALLEEYAAFDSEMNPSPSNLSSDEFDRLVTSLKKKPEQTLENISSMSLLKKLMLTMVSDPTILPTVS